MEPLNYLTPENLQEGGGDGVCQGALRPVVAVESQTSLQSVYYGVSVAEVIHVSLCAYQTSLPTDNCGK